jgi:hypothetical protein
MPQQHLDGNLGLDGLGKSGIAELTFKGRGQKK